MQSVIDNLHSIVTTEVKIGDPVEKCHSYLMFSCTASRYDRIVITGSIYPVPSSPGVQNQYCPGLKLER